MSAFRERKVESKVLQERVFDFASGEVQSQPAHEALQINTTTYSMPLRAWLETYTNTWRLVPPGHPSGNYQGHTVRVVIVAWVDKRLAGENWWRA